MIKADTIKNLTDNTLVTISNGVFSLPATSHDDHHASQILQVKSYSDQTNTDRGVQNSKWTNIYSTPPMDFRLQKKDSYIYIQVFFTHRTVSGTPDDSHSYVSIWRATPQTTSVVMQQIAEGANISTQTDILWTNLFADSSIEGQEIEYNGQYTDGEKWTTTSIQTIDTIPSTTTIYPNGHHEKFSYSFAIKNGTNGSNGQISIRNGIRILLMEIQKPSNYIPRRSPPLRDDPRYFLFTDTIVDGDFNYNLKTELVLAGWQINQKVIAQLTIKVGNYAVMIDTLPALGNSIEIQLDNKIYYDYDPHEDADGAIYLTREMLKTPSYNLQTHFSTNGWNGTAKIDGIINCRRAEGATVTDVGIQNSTNLPANSEVFIITDEIVNTIADPVFIFRYKVTQQITNLATQMTTFNWDSQAPVNGYVTIESSLDRYGILQTTLLASGSYLDIILSDGTFTMTDRLFIHRDKVAQGTTTYNVSSVYSADGWNSLTPVNTLLDISNVNNIGLTSSFSGIASNRINNSASITNVKFNTALHDIKNDLSSNRYIYFELIASNTANYVFNPTLMNTTYNWNSFTQYHAFIGIPSGVIVYSTSTSNPAIDITDIGSNTITIHNLGVIAGAGGAGGALGTYTAGSWLAPTYTEGSPNVGSIGLIGGPAIKLNYATPTSVVENYGTIIKGFGGGGGGGAGGAGPGWSTTWGSWTAHISNNAVDLGTGLHDRSSHFYTAHYGYMTDHFHTLRWGDTTPAGDWSAWSNDNYLEYEVLNSSFVNRVNMTTELTGHFKIYFGGTSNLVWSGTTYPVSNGQQGVWGYWDPYWSAGEYEYNVSNAVLSQGYQLFYQQGTSPGGGAPPAPTEVYRWMVRRQVQRRTLAVNTNGTFWTDPSDSTSLTAEEEMAQFFPWDNRPDKSVTIEGTTYTSLTPDEYQYEIYRNQDGSLNTVQGEGLAIPTVTTNHNYQAGAYDTKRTFYIKRRIWNPGISVIDGSPGGDGGQSPIFDGTVFPFTTTEQGDTSVFNTSASSNSVPAGDGALGGTGGNGAQLTYNSTENTITIVTDNQPGATGSTGVTQAGAAGGEAGPDGKAIDPGSNSTINNYGTITGDIT